MPKGPGFIALFSPTAISIHNNGNVAGQAAQVYFFLQTHQIIS
jgi:hypothetical protein